MGKHWLKYWCNFPPHYPTKWPKEGKAEKAEKVQCLQVQHWETTWTNKPNSCLKWKQRGFSIENCWKFQKLDWEHASPDLEIAWWPYLLQLRPSRDLTKKLINLNEQVEIYNGNGLIFFTGKKSTYIANFHIIVAKGVKISTDQFFPPKKLAPKISSFSRAFPKN